MKFYNDQGTNVTRRIEEGTTVTFTNHTEAVNFARTSNSYVYDLHCQQKDEKRPSFWGYAVPK
jgi:hypothetical protein